MRVTVSILALAALMACSAELAPEGGLHPFSSAAQVEEGAGAAILPMLTWQLISQLHACGEADDCPRVLEAEGGVAVEGGCVDEDGRTWHGSAWVDEGPEGEVTGIGFTDFGYDGVDGGLVVSGEQRAGEDELLVADDLEVRWWGDGPLDVPDVLISEAEKVARFQSVELLLDDAGAWSLVGGAILDEGAFTVEGSGWVSDEALHGELILEGEERAELVLDGLDEGCVPWAGGETVCPW